MKRALIVSAGTIVGVAAVLALNPDGSSATVAVKPGSTAPAATGSSGTAAARGTSGAASSAASSGTTTATGTAVDVGNGYGTIQVQATLTDGKITDITALAVPENDGRSAQISAQAFPLLVQQAIAAQSSQISGLSGASYTSNGFVESLAAALTSVGHAA